MGRIEQNGRLIYPVKGPDVVTSQGRETGRNLAEAGNSNKITIRSASSGFGVRPAYAERFRQTGRRTPGVRRNM